VNLPTLKRGAKGLGIDLSEYQLDQFEKYYTLLSEWNARFNLTAVTDYEAVQKAHFLDSLTLILAGINLENKRVIDVGAGAGFPGLPLKIAFPNIEMTLLEATGKKVRFLSEAISTLNLAGVRVINARAEDAARQPEHRERFDIAVSRAVAGLDTLCELCLPFCIVDGTFIAMKKGDIESEVSSSQSAIKKLGGRLVGVKSVDLPEFHDSRRLVVIHKTGPTLPEYPRRSGLPAKKPLR